MKQEINLKADKADIDMYVMAVSNQKQEFDMKQKQLDKDLDDLITTMHRELDQLKTSMLQSLNKKADFTLLDQVKENLHKKVDNDYF